MGAGYAGLEGLAELQDFAADLVERYPQARLEGMRFLLVEARDRVMTRDLSPTSPRSRAPSCAGAGSR